MKTELCIQPLRARLFQVAERPITEEVIPHDQIKVLFSHARKDMAVAWAEGRQSVTGQPIRLPGTW